jgi:hypothetical protein
LTFGAIQSAMRGAEKLKRKEQVAELQKARAKIDRELEKLEAQS